MAKLRIGIIGTGSMAKGHAEAYRQIKDVEVVACMDVVPGRSEAFAAAHGIALATHSEAQLLDAVDAVSIVTPDPFHAASTIAALEAGKHVLCEKPLTVTLAEAQKVALAAARNPRLIGMVNFSYRRSAAAEQAARIVAEGRLGALRHVHAHYLQSWLASDAWGHWSSEKFLWRLQTAAGSGGVLADVGVHILDLTTAVAGEAAHARCTLRSFPKIAPDGSAHSTWLDKPLDANDTALIELELAGGALGVVQATRWATGHLNQLRVEVHGTDGALRFDLDESYEQLQLCVGRNVKNAVWKSKVYKSAPTIYERFIRAIKAGQAEQPDLARGAHVQALLEACLRSDRSGRWEPLASL